MADENAALKYLVRKPAQAVRGAMGGAIIGCIPGSILMVINDLLTPNNPNNPGETGPFTKWKWPPFTIAVQGVIVGFFGGAVVGLYL